MLIYDGKERTRLDYSWLGSLLQEPSAMADLSVTSSCCDVRLLVPWMFINDCYPRNNGSSYHRTSKVNNVYCTIPNTNIHWQYRTVLPISFEIIIGDFGGENGEWEERRDQGSEEEEERWWRRERIKSEEWSEFTACCYERMLRLTLSLRDEVMEADGAGWGHGWLLIVTPDCVCVCSCVPVCVI